MVVMKFLGLLDFLAGLSILLYQYGVIPSRFMIAFIPYLLIKGFMFKGDFASIIDIGIALYMVVMLFFPVAAISWICAIYLFQKLVVSLFY